MTHRGRVKNGAVVLDQPASLPEGAAVEVNVVEPQQRSAGQAPPALDYEAPADVLEVSSRHGLSPYLALAVRLARSSFSPLRELGLEADSDPDTDERRVVLNVSVDAPVDELLRQYRDYTRA